MHIIHQIDRVQRPAFVFLWIIGFVALSSWKAVAQDLPFFENFDSEDLGSWTIVNDPEPQSGPSDWSVQDGALVQSSNVWSYASETLETKYHLGTHVVNGNPDWTDYSFNALVRSEDNDGIGLIFRYQDAGNYYRILLMNDSAWSGRDSSGVAVNTPLQRIQKFDKGEPIILAENLVSSAYPSGKWFSLTADVRGDTLSAYLDGELILSAVDDDFPSGRIGFLSYANSGAYYDSVSVTAGRLIYDASTRVVTYGVREDRVPYIQNPTQTEVEIAFRTVQPTIGKVMFGEEKGVLDRQVEESEALQKHHLKIENLSPGARYYYEVFADATKVQSEESFRSAPTYDETTFSFLVLGDSGVGNDTQQRVADQMRISMNDNEVDFIVHVGDVHQGNGSYYDDIYFKPYRDIIKNVNVFTSVGNHDTYTDNAAPYLDDFYLPHNNAERTERYYSFRWANAYYIALDTNIDYSPGSPQYAFLLEALNDPLRTSATWTFLYAHHPQETEYWINWDGTAAVREHLVPIYEGYDIDMVMNGHTHSYERGELNHVHYLVSGGGGGGLDEYAEDQPHIAFSEGKHHFTRIDVTGEQMWVSATDQYGVEFDRYLINKRTSVDVDGRGLLDLPKTLEITSLFPNPASDRINATYRTAKAAQTKVELFDVLGRRLDILVDRRQLPDTYQMTYDTSHLPNGNYVMALSVDNQVISRNFVVSR